MDTIAPHRKGLLYYVQFIVGILLLLALSATFFFSAYTKSGIAFQHFHLVSNDNAFDNFQWTLLDLGINSVFLSGIIARVLIGFELLLGLFLLFHVFLRRFTYPAVIGVLILFIIYLIAVIVRQGNTGNCGCFGTQVEMKPLAAIWKNIAMIAATVVVWFIYPPKEPKKAAVIFEDISLPQTTNKIKIYRLYVALFLATIAFSVPFLVNNVYTGTDPEKYTKAVNLDLLYKYDDVKPTVDLRQGKHIIAFMSLTCPHCRKAAYLLQIIHRDHPDIPIFMVLDGPPSFQKKFFEETHAENVPYVLFYGHTPDFGTMAGSGVPSIYWVNNGVVEYKSVYTYYQLDPAFMEKWLKKP